MYYSKINKYDVANGTGVRVTIFVSGCTNHCKDCFQPQTWDFNYGQEYTKEVENEIIAALDRPYIKGITLLGGEPMEPKNQEGMLQLTNRIRADLPEKDIWCYTGFVLEDLLKDGTYCHTEYTNDLLHNIDVLIDGRFVEELKNLKLVFRGSSNQRLIDMKKTLDSGKVVLMDIKDRDSDR